MGKVYEHWKDFPMDQWRWPSFSPEEMASNRFIKGKSGPVEKAELMIDGRSMDMLQALRDGLGKPMIVNSAYRSPDYNKKIGGAVKGYHPKAMAFDISMANHNPAEFEAAAIAAGFRGIGHYPGSNFMHIDSRPTAKVARWKGTGPNNAWFPKDTGGFSSVEPKPQGLVGIIGKAEVLMPVAATALTAAAPMAEGNGPVQYAIAAGLCVLVLAFAGFIAAKILRRPIDV